MLGKVCAEPSPSWTVPAALAHPHHGSELYPSSQKQSLPGVTHRGSQGLSCCPTDSRCLCSEGPGNRNIMIAPSLQGGSFMLSAVGGGVWDSSSMCSRKSRPHFPPRAAAQRDPLGKDTAFLRKGGRRGVGEKVTHKEKNKTLAGPGMCRGESEPSLLSHPQLCWPGRGTGHRQSRVTPGTGRQLPTCS